MKGGVGLSLPCFRKKLPSKAALLGLKDDHTSGVREFTHSKN